MFLWRSSSSHSLALGFSSVLFHKDTLQLHNLLGWFQRSHISTNDSWIHLTRKISSVHTVFIYNPCNCHLVRNLWVKLLSKRLLTAFIFHSWTIACPWTKLKTPMARQQWWKTCTLSSFLGFSLSFWLALWFRAPHFDRYFGACPGKSSTNSLSKRLSVAQTTENMNKKAAQRWA